MAATCAASKSFQYMSNQYSGEMHQCLENNTVDIKDFVDDSQGYIERYFYTVPIKTLGTDSHPYDSARTFIENEKESAPFISAFNGAST